MGQFVFLLKALGAPQAFEAAQSDQLQYRKLVYWLENMKIRTLKMADRKELSDGSIPSWEDAYKKYLEEVECPVQYSISKQHEVLEWLVRFAVHQEYTDHAEEVRKTAAPATSAATEKPSTSGFKKAAPLADVSSAEVAAQLRGLCSKLHIEYGALSTLQMAQAVLEMLGDQVLPCLQQAASGKEHSQSSDLLGLLPLGFETGDSMLDTAATVLRLLYVKDLRALQSRVDQAIVDVQEYTANPRTDSSLGKVGR